MSSTLPSFARPPVIETAISIQFAPIADWNTGHFGVFWSQVRGDFPKLETHTALPSEIEAPHAFVQNKPGVQIEIGVPTPRCWLVSDDGREIVQLQDSRFGYNWRAIHEGDAYPRYDAYIRPQFLLHWSKFLEFLDEEQLKRPSVVQCEMVYVNIIEQGAAWTSVSDWGRVLNVLASSPSHIYLPPPESGRCSFSFLMPDKLGRLRVEASHVLRTEDGGEAIKLQIIARGCPETNATNDVIVWIDRARKWIVRGFADITTRECHAIWGLDENG